ncbi:hypothetical protein A2763_02805 [Candidatus Kaiserbacteria bacterium RIFCSPHIGHO2_01_FULL_54_36]|uniref:Lumazine-binding domain-containing protein n=1 Tax=Candidatus Kaiserbacteria bacterium RIFCSPHIGHO2_01_FULL_54_36 TaxID=1798482 RepID=A0A1F6CP20_9BACT|nr:MAG: hypothetical protein A2763_02805 [Candidatus Kaiserbacteria bacterium RIFCSPHIGHO2_01_FULL_54_36]OGG75244.1 MAG: hypothetical protein A3A41_03945 [Candidatus Kaiserbacteria bacterium RIFCSPLOWO2_01_FULL_54_22]
MFTGVVEKTSKIVSAEICGGCRCVRIRKPREWKVSNGQSISIDGICSTVVSFEKHSFDVEYMQETLSKTTAASFAKDTVVNLERSLKYGARVEGHLIQGHVDARIRLAATVEKGRSREIIVATPRALGKRITVHGSIALNGVSLTVARKRGATIAVALIPHTTTHTNLGLLSVGDMVNIELDHSALLVRRVARGRVVRNATKRIYKKD